MKNNIAACESEINSLANPKRFSEKRIRRTNSSRVIKTLKNTKRLKELV